MTKPLLTPEGLLPLTLFYAAIEKLHSARDFAALLPSSQWPRLIAEAEAEFREALGPVAKWIDWTLH